ncbi:MAG TPA: hypothetical protein DIW47_06820 [Bacteroidetes bacterium]|nr:hypothetical protein [Bacteroidota bacterium]
MQINTDTKIETILQAHPDALNAIISVSSKFNKLRNPVLRKLMAPRVSLNMASKVGNCSPEDFYKKLEPLGFVIDRLPKAAMPAVEAVPDSSDWEESLARFEDRLETLDVRTLEMPQPMIRILFALESLPESKALFVHHKRIPVFLLPELKDRNMDYRIKTISEGEVNMLIFRK